ncbi:MAG: helix-turn-helix domain-containing protein [Actinobacteria bacterium]|nr:helix-turn-helix domain-containing protein [Actinomycetota bacterium]
MDRELVPAAEAAEMLGVKRQTLYAYVSRGLLASHHQQGTRGSLFDPAELDGLLQQGRGKGESPRPDVVIESGLTRIDDDGHFYRGRAAIDLAATASFESVSEFLWHGGQVDAGSDLAPVSWNFDVDVELIDKVADLLGPRAAPLDWVRVLLPLLAAADPMRADIRPAAVESLGRQLLPLLFVAASVGAQSSNLTRSSPETARAASVALGAVGGDSRNEREVRIVNQVLVLMADHELAASTAAVRLAASFGADPYASLQAGYAVIGGAMHGAASTAVERFIADVVEAGEPAIVVGERLRAGEHIPGLGHSVYPGVDPRFTALFEFTRQSYPTSSAVQAGGAIIGFTRERGLPEPNVDFAIAVLAHASGWNEGAGEVLFALARSAGWIGHAIEEYTQRSNIRLRAVYTGPRL